MTKTETSPAQQPQSATEPGDKYQQTFSQIMSLADVQLNGEDPADIQVHNPALYKRVLAGGSLALGEAYMDGWWDCQALDQFFTKVLASDLDERIVPLGMKYQLLKSKLFNMQTKLKARKVIEVQYDLSADLFMSFLDPYNQYTCGYFKDTDNLNTAQEQKLDMICQKLEISETDKVLDIGCGWGGFAKFAAERYGCQVVGLTISDSQMAYAKKFCKGLPVEIVKTDYRESQGTFDKVLVCGMIEHVGYKNYRHLMQIVHDRLRPGGLFLLHTIGRSTSTTRAEPWYDKYIFPNGMLPSPKQLMNAAEGLFTLNDWHSFGKYYDNTLMAWYENFVHNWDRIKSAYDERFFRMWIYYLTSSAAGFRCNLNQLWQIILAKQDEGLDSPSLAFDRQRPE